MPEKSRHPSKLRRIDSLDEAGQLGQLLKDVTRGFIYKGMKPSGIVIGLRGFYFTPNGNIEYGTLFFGKKVRDVERLSQAIERCSQVEDFKRGYEDLSVTAEEHSFLHIPERKTLLLQAARALPSRVMAAIVLTRDQATANLSTYVGFPPTLLDPNIALDVRETWVGNPAIFKEHLPDDSLEDLKTADPSWSREIAEVYAFQAILGARHNMGNFHLPTEGPNLTASPL